MRHEALEFLDTRPVRNVSLCCEAGRNDEVFRLASPAVCGLDMPFTSFGVEFRTNNHTFECRVTLDVQNFVAMIEVVSQLSVGGILEVRDISISRCPMREKAVGNGARCSANCI